MARPESLLYPSGILSISQNYLGLTAGCDSSSRSFMSGCNSDGQAMDRALTRKSGIYTRLDHTLHPAPHLQDCGLCLEPLFLLPVPGVDDLNFLFFQGSGYPALPPSFNHHRWYRPAVKARLLSLSLKLSQLGLRDLDARLLRRHGGVCSPFANTLPTVGKHLRCLVRPGGKQCSLSRRCPQDGQQGALLACTPRHWCQNCPWKCRCYLSEDNPSHSRRVGPSRAFAFHTSIVSFPMHLTKVAFGGFAPRHSWRRGSWLGPTPAVRHIYLNNKGIRAGRHPPQRMLCLSGCFWVKTFLALYWLESGPGSGPGCLGSDSSSMAVAKSSGLTVPYFPIYSRDNSSNVLEDSAKERIHSSPTTARSQQMVTAVSRFVSALLFVCACARGVCALVYPCT